MNLLNIFFLKQTFFRIELEKMKSYNIIDKSISDSASFNSYDAFLMGINIFKDRDDRILFLETLLNTKKPVIVIFSDGMDTKNPILDYLKEKYNIVFTRTDASVLEKEGFCFNFPNGIRETYAMTSNLENLQVFIKNTQKGLIYKKGNLIVMHDNSLNYEYLKEMMQKSQSNSQEIFNAWHNSFTKLMQHILSVEEIAEKPSWIDNITILDDEELLKKKDDVNNEIVSLIEEKNKIEESIENNELYKKVFYTNGDELVDVVKLILAEMLNIPIKDIDVKKEDLSFKIGKKKILAEVKGINTGVKRGNVSQVENHILDDAEKENIDDKDIEKHYKGVLIINPYDKHDLKDKITKDIYGETVVTDIKKKDICTIDTMTLLNWFSKYKKDNKSISLANIILNNNYNKPDFKDIIK